MAVDAMLRAIIVDDEALAVERLAVLCSGLDSVEVVGSANDGETALELIATLAPDLVLLDVSMPERDGLGVARALGEMPQRPGIIFCTAFDRFAVEAFDVAAVDYLLKPVTQERLARAVGRVAAISDRPVVAGSPVTEWAEDFWVPHRGELIRIAALDIDRIEADRDYMRLHVGSRRYLLNQTITRLEQRLDPTRFLRVHRSHIVRRDQVLRLSHNGFGAWTIGMKDGTEIRVGRRYLAAVRRMASSV